MTQRELQTFSQYIQKEFEMIETLKPYYTQTELNHRLVAIKDIVYYLGVSIAPDKYSYSDGFKKFCQERLGICPRTFKPVEDIQVLN